MNFRPLDFFELNNVAAHLGVRVNEISPDSGTVHTEGGRAYEFDKLLLATGGHAIVPPIPGTDKEGVSTLKTMRDAERVLNLTGKKAVVIGAGSIGVEACISLQKRGMKATLVEQLGQVLPTVFDEEAAGIIQPVIEDKGIEVLLGERAVEFSGNGRVKRVVTTTKEIACDLVVLAVGVRPATELAKAAGIEIGPTGGIKTDAHLMTSHPDVYAAGDVCETVDITREAPFVNAIWPMAVEQGRIAGLNMAGRETAYGGSVRMNSIGNFIGFPAMSMGVTHPGQCSYEDPDCHFQEIKKQTRNTFKKLILKNDRIVGAIFIGQTQKSGLITTLLRRQLEAADFIPELMSDHLNFMDIAPLFRRHGDKFTEPEFKELMDTGL
jgi:nitrite reductase (NADH) large subunit